MSYSRKDMEEKGLKVRIHFSLFYRQVPKKTLITCNVVESLNSEGQGSGLEAFEVWAGSSNSRESSVPPVSVYL